MNLFGRHILTLPNTVGGTEPRRSLLPSYEHILTTPLYGSIGNEAYYYLNIFVGNPPQKQSVILDTGSSIFGFPCSGCSSCGTHVNELFDFNSSTTSHWLDCNDKECFSNKCSHTFANDRQHCGYYQAYSEGSSISGNYFSDLISLTALKDGKDRQSRAISYDTQLTTRYNQIGCHEIETRLFVGQLANGIIGVAFHHSHQPSAMDALFYSSPHWDDKEPSAEDKPQKIFSICISDQGGIMTMGGVDPNYLVVDSLTESSMSDSGQVVKNRRLWNIEKFFEEPEHKLTDGNQGLLETRLVSESGYSIGAETMHARRLGEENKILIQGSFGESTIVDSGTTYTYFPPKLYSSLFTYFSDICNEMDNCTSNSKGNLSEICYIAKAKDSEDHKNVLAELDDVFPTLYITLRDGIELPWPPRSYMYFNSGNIGCWCLAMDNNHVKETVLGMNFIKNRMAIFDRENHKLGILKGDCPITTDATRDTQEGPSFDDQGNNVSDTTNRDHYKDNNITKTDNEQKELGNGLDEAILYRYMKLKLDWQEDKLWLFVSAAAITAGAIWLVIRARKQRMAAYGPQRDGEIRQQTELVRRGHQNTTPAINLLAPEHNISPNSSTMSQEFSRGNS